MPRPRHHKLHPFGSFLDPPPPPHGGPHHGPPDGPHHLPPPPPHGPHHHPHVEWPYMIDEPSVLAEAAGFLADIFNDLAESGVVELNDEVTVSPPADVHLVVRHAVVADGSCALEAALIWKSNDNTESGATSLASALAKRKSRQTT